MTLQVAYCGIAANGIAGLGARTFDVKWPLPFAEVPLVWSGESDAWFNASVDSVTTTGCKLGIRNLSPDIKPSVNNQHPVFAYGKLA
jgi:hypothetical protein